MPELWLSPKYRWTRATPRLKMFPVHPLLDPEDKCALPSITSKSFDPPASPPPPTLSFFVSYPLRFGPNVTFPINSYRFPPLERHFYAFPQHLSFSGANGPQMLYHRGLLACLSCPRDATMTQQENMLSAPYTCCLSGVPTAGRRALPTGPAEASTHTYVSFVYSNQY